MYNLLNSHHFIRESFQGASNAMLVDIGAGRKSKWLLGSEEGIVFQERSLQPFIFQMSRERAFDGFI